MLPATFLLTFQAVAGVPDPLPEADAVPALEAPALPAFDEGPWNLDDALGTSDWLTIDGYQRTRYESLDEPIRASRSGSDQLWALRNVLRLRAQQDEWGGTFEVWDTRQLGAPEDSSVGTGTVNALEIIELNVRHTSRDVMSSGDSLEWTVGRQTQDLGSRRFLARNRFRNTTNTFTGVHGQWDTAAKDTVRAFWLVPDLRLPRDKQGVLDNDIEFDQPRTQVQFFGVDGLWREVAPRTDLELYALGLVEDDGFELNTKNRSLATFGGRHQRKPAVGAMHWTLEGAYQVGKSRASSSASDTTDLDHLAGWLSLRAGTRLEGETKPTLDFETHYASGDQDPTDGDQNRFDTLFGKRRYDYGPTGLFGAYARANLVSAGLRLTLNPTSSTNLMLAYRVHRLASAKDQWVPTGLVDPTGNSGKDVGALAEFRLRWDVEPDQWQFECGAAYLDAGSFSERAPNATGQGDALYGYISLKFAF